MKTIFDILKKDRKGTFHWVEAVNDIDTAQTRLLQLSAESTDEFVVFRNIDLKVVATSNQKSSVGTTRACSICAGLVEFLQSFAI